MIYLSSLLILFPPPLKDGLHSPLPLPPFLKQPSEKKKVRQELICLTETHTLTSPTDGKACSFNRLLWRAPLQCGRFQPQLYGEYMVVKPLMKMEDSVDSGKQLSEKDGGSNLFSLPPALLFPPSDCLSFNEEPTYLKGPFRAAERWGTFRMGHRCPNQDRRSAR